MATFPLNYPWPNKACSYVICEDTFPIGKRNEWKKFITHAISQWDLATKNLATTERVEGECAEYSVFVGEVIAAVESFAMGTNLPGIPPTDAEIEAHATALLEKFDQLRIETTRELDKRLNEVLMVDDSSAAAVTVDAFNEISMRVGRLGNGECSPACAQRTDLPNGHTVDILLRDSGFKIADLSVPGTDDTADAGEIPFNTCGSVHYRYGSVVHEAGHALGIGGGITGTKQGRFHPHIKDSVMSYGRDKSVGCSPNPFDIMAIYALYQGR